MSGMSTYIISHDIGTTGDKAVLFGENGTLQASIFSGYQVINLRPNWVEQDPEDYWRAFCTATAELIEKTGINPADIGVIAFSGQMQAALPIDENLEPLRNSLIWADLRSTEEVDRLEKSVGREAVYAITGHRLNASYTASKIMWIKKHEPEIYRKTCKFIHAKDFIAAKLTGVIATDLSDASGMNLFDINQLAWSEEILDAAGIDREKLPDVAESTAVIGNVTEKAAAACGLKAGTPVVIGGGDGACATSGAGVVKKGDSYICLGTSTWLASTVAAPTLDKEERTVTFCHFKKGLYFVAGTMQSGGGAMEWFKNTLGNLEAAAVSGSSIDAYGLLRMKAEHAVPGSRGLLFLPHLMGERAPYWNPEARGCFIGLSTVHTKAEMVRSVMEGVALHIRLIEDALREQGVESPAHRIIGGGARNDLWLSIFADVLGKPVRKLNFLEEATSVGAAIAGGVGVGMFSSLEEAARLIKVEDEWTPNADNRNIYARLYEAYAESYNALLPVFSKIASIN